VVNGAVVCLLTAPRVHLSDSMGSGLLDNALQYHWLMPISHHFKDCKVPLGETLDSVLQQKVPKILVHPLLSKTAVQ